MRREVLEMEAVFAPFGPRSRIRVAQVPSSVHEKYKPLPNLHRRAAIEHVRVAQPCNLVLAKPSLGQWLSTPDGVDPPWLEGGSLKEKATVFHDPRTNPLGPKCRPRFCP